MTIDFPNRNPVCTSNDTVAFAATYNGEGISCEISSEALQDHFGASTFQQADLLRAFISGRSAIEAVARLKIPHCAAGRYLLVSSDFGRP
jgi:uncharacterized protein DUF1488